MRPRIVSDELRTFQRGVDLHMTRTCRAGVPMATIYGEHHVKKEEAN